MSTASRYVPPSYAAAAGADLPESSSVSLSRWAPVSSSSPSPLLASVSNTPRVVSSVKIVTASEAAAASPPVDDTKWPPNPFLTQPKLYMTHLPANITKRYLAHDVFNHCLPVKFEMDDLVNPSMATGLVHFSHLVNAELAYATIDTPVLTIRPPEAGPDPAAHSKRRVINQLPRQINVAEAFKLLRPFGPLRRVTLITTNAQTGHPTGFRGTAAAEFYAESDAQAAERALHCSNVGGNSVSVGIDTINRAGRNIRASAPVFVPRLVIPEDAMGAQASVFASSPSASLQGFVHSLTSPLSPWELVGGYASSALTTQQSRPKLIDPLNLFIKHLAPTVNSSDLYKAFSPFGDIVSARVMRDDRGNSRSFGFVSYKHSDEAAEALRHMHRSVLDGQVITVSLHQPKVPRQGKLARPALVSTGSGPYMLDSTNPDNSVSPCGEARRCQKLQRKKSNSYFRDAMEADLRGERYTFPQLAALSATVRNEVLAGLLARRLKTLPGFDDIAAEEGVYHLETPEEAAARHQALLDRAARRGEGEGKSLKSQPEKVNWTDEEVQQIVEEMVAKIPLAEAVEALDNPEVLLEQALHHANTAIGISSHSNQTPASVVSGGVPLGLVGRTTSLGESHPSRKLTSTMGDSPRSVESDHGTALVSSIDLSAVASGLTVPSAGMSERDKMLVLVQAFSLPSETLVRDVTDLIVGLPKKERALCLFNRGFLEQKVREARSILDLTEDDYVEDDSSSEGLVLGSPSRPQDTLEILAALPLAELLGRLQSGALAPSIPPATANQLAATEAFVASLNGMTPNDAKQCVGARVFRAIKVAGIKGATKLTIRLLDTEDLRSLAHLADSFPLALQKKAYRLQL